MADRDSSDPSEIKVVDKRRFTESGSAREQGESADVENPFSRPNREGKPVSVDNNPPSSRIATTAPESRASGPAEHFDGPKSEVDFSSFVVSLATQALACMGEVQHPGLAGVPVNADAARQLIDVLRMLRTKTENNLSEDETKLMAEIVASLQLAFVQKFSK